ncbi:hypothetical protein [Absidia glauca]|uniref:Kinesin motor domain-containing protein n=1 Tax=Absidia glauca TaxID=4829 RepID=A0A163ITY6_ABSGL|nr:hypothetical protein [Absidia glauca]
MTSTAVRVALRVRPLTTKEQLSNCNECLTFIPNEPQVLIGPEKAFTYDYVFDTKSTQASVYSSAIAPLLHKFMDGFNATVLAYGQTGAGKTFSMGTGLDNTKDKANQGIVPRCILELFQVLQEKADNEDGYTYEVLVSFLELHNEDLIDLLNPPALQKRRSHNGQVPQHAEVSIREDIAGNIYWTGVKEERCFSPEELLGLLEKGSLCRTTASTDMNTVSSRSHAMFTVTLKQQFLEQADQDDSKKVPKCLTSKFHFVDLAGSERLKRTNAEGDRAKEGIAINAGLLALGNVISALGDDTRRAVHVPYRDSKLTRLLQDSLGGNSQTLMMACVSPSDSNFGETLNTLRYANRARNIKNKVTVNQDFTGSSLEVNQLRALVSRLRTEITALRSKGDGLSLYETVLDDETQALRKEVSTLRKQLQHSRDDVIQVSTERDTLLIERETTNGATLPSATTNDEQQTTIATHPVIENYLKIIRNLNTDLMATKSRLEVLENSQQHRTAQDPSTATSSDDTKRQRRKPGAIGTSKRRFRKVGRISTTTSSSTTSASTNVGTKIVHPSKAPGPLRKHRSHLPPPTTVSSALPTVGRSNHYRYASDNGVNYYRRPTFMDDDDEGYVNDTEDEHMRFEFKESIAKARAEIRKGMEFLELIKPDDAAVDTEILETRRRKLDVSTKTQPIERELSDEGTFSASTSPTPLADEFDKELPHWLADIGSSQDGDTLAMSHSSSNQLSSGSYVDLDTKEQDPKLLRMLQQIQSDIKVNEELVCHLEKSESEYLLMRRKFDDKIHQLHDQLAGLQQNRDDALQQTKGLFNATANGGPSMDTAQQQQAAREKQQLLEIRQAYETKMKHLLNEIQDLKRKYSQTTNTMNVTRNQNESLLKSLRANVETLKVEKKQMMKRMKLDGDRVREQITQQDRRIQQLQRQHTEASVARRRLERERDIQKQTLRKRNEEMVNNSGQLKQLIFIMKKAVREGGLLDERLLGKVSLIVGGNFAVLGRSSQGFPLRGGGHTRGNHSSSSSSSNNSNITQGTNKAVSAIPLHIRTSRKKSLLEKAMLQYVKGKQTLVEIEQVLARRERLSGEKQGLLDRRRQVYLVEIQRSDATGTPLDTTPIEVMDEQIELITAEIAFLSSRLCSLQTKARSIVSSQQQKQRTGKHVTFADDIVTDPPPSDEWADIDALEEQFSVPANAAPELSYKMATKLLKSLQPDECKKIAESLLESNLNLQITDSNRQMTLQHLERALTNTRYNLIVMRRAAVASTVENERRIRRLENSIIGADNNQEGQDIESLAAMDRKMEEFISGGNTIFDRIYEDGLQELINSASWSPLEDSSGKNDMLDNGAPPDLLLSHDSCGTNALLASSIFTHSQPPPPPISTERQNIPAPTSTYEAPNSSSLVPNALDYGYNQDFLDGSVDNDDSQPLDFPSPPLRIETTTLHTTIDQEEPPPSSPQRHQDDIEISPISLDMCGPLDSQRLPDERPALPVTHSTARRSPPPQLQLTCAQPLTRNLIRQHPTPSTPLPTTKKTMGMPTPPATPNRHRSSSLLLHQQKQPPIMPSPSSPLLARSKHQRHSLPAPPSSSSSITMSRSSSCALNGSNVFNRLASTSTRASRAKVHRLSC